MSNKKGESCKFSEYVYCIFDFDIDNMSYEEVISSHLKQHKYEVSATSDLQELKPCCICQDEYNNDDDLGELVMVTRKNLCPICKTTAMGEKEKV
ncbi:hypothetical protein DCAR_0624939 [Daucus carota subsp. sativus]|uniref:RING-type E3 ubiquitin transferase n=1 Tax=Daucus carota subsp. sativus TaxID=79200 RepID=A0AAF0XEF2_DAUCS|nr:hypothetical protein DCAR_0624939 [Daucus carota subsp. sativus]